MIQIWSVTSEETLDSDPGGKRVKFSVGHHEDLGQHDAGLYSQEEGAFVKPEHDVEIHWETVWRCRLVKYILATT